jgi:hypothetical protein
MNNSTTHVTPLSIACIGLNYLAATLTWPADLRLYPMATRRDDDSCLTHLLAYGLHTLMVGYLYKKLVNAKPPPIGRRNMCTG